MRVILFLICFLFKASAIIVFSILLICITEWLMFYINQLEYDGSLIKKL